MGLSDPLFRSPQSTREGRRLPALMAATLYGDHLLLHRTMRDFGMHPEMALHAKAWRPDLLPEAMGLWSGTP